MSPEPDEGTLSLTDEPEGAVSVHSRPHLFLVLESHQPAAAPVRFGLGALDQVLVGRGAQLHVETARHAGGQRLTVRVADPWMSSSHAHFLRLLRRWVVEDAGSKNGISVNGQKVSRAELEDGDLIEIGRSFFLFREGVPSLPSDAPVQIAGASSTTLPGMVTLVPSLARAFVRLGAIARSRVSVVIQGETGTGKEVAARAVHTASGRSGDFVALNCGALPAALVEGELFGHKKGAFSGASEERAGLVRAADKGTLFLDEIGDLPASAQTAFLRVLQEGEVVPLGGTKPIPVDLRVIAATHRPLDQLVESGAFRADLFARLSGHRIELPPLRERREDLGLYIGTLLARLAPERATSVKLHPKAALALLRWRRPSARRWCSRAPSPSPSSTCPS
jgi:pSer/pThr/pTyr-binding forkhead associated (FHA) protein